MKLWNFLTTASADSYHSTKCIGKGNGRKGSVITGRLRRQVNKKRRQGLKKEIEEMMADTEYLGPLDANGNPIVSDYKMGAYDSFTPENMNLQMAEKYQVAETSDTGFNTGRKRFRVVCNVCQKELHWNTTGPQFYIYNHEREGCKSPE